MKLGYLLDTSICVFLFRRKYSSHRTQEAVSDMPSVVKDLIGVVSGITKKEIEEDARLFYLLNK